MYHLRAILKSNSLVSRCPAISSVFQHQKLLISQKAEFFIHPRTYCTQKLPQNKNVFGDLGFSEHRRIEMDEAEKAEEEFTENEARLPRRARMSPGKYANLIKSHIGKLDLDAALGVLDLAKKNRDKPTLYMYNLLIRAFSIQGDMKQCFRLYSALKKRGMEPSEPTYTSLLNSIANSADKRGAMEKLVQLREIFVQKGVILNDTHYNAIINAYGRHGKLLEAFNMADEMRDRRLEITECTFNTLLCCAISDKEAGMRHALYVWHLMKTYKVKPTTTSYNLLLRAIRDTKFGELKIDDVLLIGDESSRVIFNEEERPDLLASPPTFCTVPMVKNSKKKPEKFARVKVPRHTEVKLEKNLLASNLGDKELVINEKDLNTIKSYNALILFGGFDGILRRMKEDDAVPDVKTVTLLMEMSPNSVAIEQLIMDAAFKHHLTLDIDFFNVLIKKRSFRHEYDSARQVLFEIQKYNLVPDIVTWGSLALTCDTPEEAKTFLETMDSIGFMPNSIILGTLLIKLSRSKNRKKFEGMEEMLEYMKTNDMKPTRMTIEKLDEYIQKVIFRIKTKDNEARLPTFRKNFQKFCDKYYKFKEKMLGKPLVYNAKPNLKN